MEIFPKIDEKLNGFIALYPYLKKAKGIEIQMLEMNYQTFDMNFESPIKILTNNFNLEEITVHTPISFCEIELYFFKLKELYSLVDKFIKVSNQYNIDLNILFHTHLSLDTHKLLTTDIFKDLLKYIENTRLTILIENVVFSEDNEFTPGLLCEYINNPKLKVCFDLCHVKIRSLIYKQSTSDYFKTYLTENSYKYIKQIHFSDNRNDGYIDKNTHSSNHESYTEFLNDINILKTHNLLNANFVVEINEIDYSSRSNEIKEIKFLETINN